MRGRLRASGARKGWCFMFEVSNVEKATPEVAKLLIAMTDGPNAGLRFTAFFNRSSKEIEIRFDPASRQRFTIGVPEETFEHLRAVVEEAMARERPDAPRPEKQNPPPRPVPSVKRGAVKIRA